jgi:hypothetical protein
MVQFSHGPDKPFFATGLAAGRTTYSIGPQKELMIVKNLTMAGTFLAAVCMFGFMGTLYSGEAAELKTELKAEQKADQSGLQQGLKESLGVTVLKGEVWQKMTYDSKMAFIWGFGHVVSIEQNLMVKFPELKRENFSAKVVEGMADMPMEKVVARIDEYYRANPDQLQSPVTNVIWDTMIKPNITTGIAGRPLKK